MTVRDGSRSFRVWCRPRGSELRDLTADPSVRWVQWFSALPGVLSLVGLILHHTVYKSAWIITVEPLGTTIAESIRIDGLRKKDALSTLDEMVAAIAGGESLTRFATG